MKAIRRQKHVVKLIDVIEDSRKISYVLKHYEQRNLLEVLEENTNTQFELVDMLQMLRDIAVIL